MKKTKDIIGFQLTHKVKGKETITRFTKEEFDLFKEWVEICKQNNFDFSVDVIREGGAIEPFC